MPLYRVDTDQGDELALRMSEENPQPGERIELDGRWYVVSVGGYADSCRRSAMRGGSFSSKSRWHPPAIENAVAHEVAHADLRHDLADATTTHEQVEAEVQALVRSGLPRL